MDSFKKVKEDYEMVLNEWLKWVKNKNLNMITHEVSLKIHNLLEDVRNERIPNKEIGMEAMLSDDILIRYEVIIKTINNERAKDATIDF